MGAVRGPPPEGTIFEKERQRGNACQHIFTAGEPVPTRETKYDMGQVHRLSQKKRR